MHDDNDKHMDKDVKNDCHISSNYLPSLFLKTMLIVIPFSQIYVPVQVLPLPV